MDEKTREKLDEKSRKKLKEGSGPCDECLCSDLYVPEENNISGWASVKRALGSLSSKKRRNPSADVTLDCKDGICSYKEVVSNTSCGKCGCSDKKLVLRHHTANIRITAPDVSSICPCPNDCLPEEARRLNNNIKVTIERIEIPYIDTTDSEFSIKEIIERQTVNEPILTPLKDVELLSEEELTI